MNSRVWTRRRASPRIAVGAISFAALAAMAALAAAAPGPGGAEKVVEVEVVAAPGRPFLGINMQELDSAILKGLDPSVKKGVLVTNVIEGSPAEKAGVEDGDIVIAFGRKEVGSPSELKDLVDKTEVGDTVTMKVLRDGKPHSIKVTIGERSEDEEVSVSAPKAFEWSGDPARILDLSGGRGRLGVQVAELNEGLAPYFGLEGGAGVLVLDVVDESAAAKMGIKPGDVIRAIDGERVGSVEDLVGAVGALETGKRFEISLVRDRKEITLEGEAPEKPIDAYVKAFDGFKGEKAPKIEKYFMRRDLSDLPGVDAKRLRKEMDEMKRELQKMKKELEKIKDSA